MLIIHDHDHCHETPHVYFRAEGQEEEEGKKEKRENIEIRTVL